MKAWLLRLHRWVALVFALPLVLVLGTGLILSFEPWLVVGSIKSGALTPAAIEKLLSQHDPAGKARALSYRSYDNTLTIGGGRGAKGTTVDAATVDAATGEVQAGPSALARTLLTMRRMHETLLLDLGWLVIASTASMLMLTVLGVLMGWPRFANTLSGWHKAMAWGLLPLIILSPLTGLLLAARISFTGPPAIAPATRGAPMTLTEAVRIVGRDHDLSALVWLRPMGGQVLARLAEDGEYKVYAVTREGAVATPRNWPRLWHEGNFAGVWSALMNVVISVAMIGLLVTGLWIWLRRQLRRRARRMAQTAPA
jgi:uncharacterized iron-regulated membrane protein